MAAFFGTDLELVLRGLGVERLVVGGTSPNWAIESTVRDGDSRDYAMNLVREATGARIAELHEPSLLALRYAEVRDARGSPGLALRRNRRGGAVRFGLPRQKGQ